MGWKKNVDDIKIICKKCNNEMVLESSLNLVNGIYICGKCNEHLNIGIFPSDRNFVSSRNKGVSG